jgi:micrococcal nuclease
LAKRSTRKYSIVSLLLLLAFYCYYIYNNKEEKPAEPAIEKPVKVKKGRKPKEKAELRYLTVFEGKVTGIKDGDTFEVLYDNQPERVRLADIDCPENAQPFGKNAKQYASGLCFGKVVTVTSTGKRDRYHRIVGTITTQQGVNVNEELVRAGMAWHYKQYSKNDDLAALEEEARTEKAGLWADKRAVAPWDWRKNKRKKRTVAAGL